MKATSEKSRVSEQMNQLGYLLEQQVVLVQQDKISNLESLVEQTGNKLDQIIAAGPLHTPDFPERIRRLSELYRHLLLAIDERTDRTQQRLGEVRKGQKTLQRYQQGS